MKHFNALKIIIPIYPLLLFMVSCEYEGPDALWNPDYDLGATPVIESVSPEGVAVAITRGEEKPIERIVVATDRVARIQQIAALDDVPLPVAPQSHILDKEQTGVIEEDGVRRQHRGRTAVVHAPEARADAAEELVTT